MLTTWCPTGLYLTCIPSSITTSRGNSDYPALLTSAEMATELAVIETVDTAKEMAGERHELGEVMKKLEGLIEVRGILRI